METLVIALAQIIGRSVVLLGGVGIFQECVSSSYNGELPNLSEAIFSKPLEFLLGIVTGLLGAVIKILYSVTIEVANAVIHIVWNSIPVLGSIPLPNFADLIN